jgi:hypothetical protein
MNQPSTTGSGATSRGADNADSDHDAQLRIAAAQVHATLAQCQEVANAQFAQFVSDGSSVAFDNVRVKAKRSGKSATKHTTFDLARYSGANRELGQVPSTTAR